VTAWPGHDPLAALDHGQRSCNFALAAFLGEQFIVEGQAEDEARSDETVDDD